MKLTRFVHLYLVVSLLSCVTLAQPKLTWYPFDATFISARYSDSAIGALPAKASRAAKNVHAETCGGNDAGLHTGWLDGGSRR